MKRQTPLVAGVALSAVLAASSAFAQASATWNDLPDRFQIDAGYFRMDASTQLRFNGPQGGSGQVDFEDDLGRRGARPQELNPRAYAPMATGGNVMMLSYARSSGGVGSSRRTAERQVSWATGLTTRVGADFDTIGVASADDEMPYRG